MTTGGMVILLICGVIWAIWFRCEMEITKDVPDRPYVWHPRPPPTRYEWTWPDSLAAWAGLLTLAFTMILFEPIHAEHRMTVLAFAIMFGVPIVIWAVTWCVGHLIRAAYGR